MDRSARLRRDDRPLRLPHRWLDLDDGRTRLVATSLVDSFEARDAILASGMDTGVRDGYEKLDAILAGTAR